MKFRYPALSFTLFLFFLVLAYINLYQGSELRDAKLEWNHLAKFTFLFHGAPIHPDDINLLDYFIYSAKYFPSWMAVMIVVFVLFIVSIFILLRQYIKLRQVKS
ncbi:DUF4306 domain-containing protein [Falsibacillus pallidus]|uniref:DUF4306 domain-containing protein n=1 Tax=Falsibacillus pallidus TaxID=493781 RepID=UPI003D95EF44